ncbi:hypothetical protein BJ742DRAFT_780216 [Cladochytrium replicatum]|nr:hypothetical protein BJ742DRAFT_780216 [Cladochytrium replicatum]
MNVPSQSLRTILAFPGPRCPTSLPLSRPLSASFYTWSIPKDTPRIQLEDGSTLIYRRNEPAGNSETGGVDESLLPPRLRKSYPTRAWLSSEQTATMAKLRQEDPDTWTVDH